MAGDHQQAWGSPIPAAMPPTAIPGLSLGPVPLGACNFPWSWDFQHLQVHYNLGLTFRALHTGLSGSPCREPDPAAQHLRAGSGCACLSVNPSIQAVEAGVPD